MRMSRPTCSVLYCIVLYCLYCIVLYCIVFKHLYSASSSLNRSEAQFLYLTHNRSLRDNFMCLCHGHTMYWLPLPAAINSKCLSCRSLNPKCELSPGSHSLPPPPFLQFLVDPCRYMDWHGLFVALFRE